MNSVGHVRPEPCQTTWQKARDVLGIEHPTTGYRAHISQFVPGMPEAFYGRVTFNFQAGKMVLAEVVETIKL